MEMFHALSYYDQWLTNVIFRLYDYPASVSSAVWPTEAYLVSLTFVPYALSPRHISFVVLLISDKYLMFFLANFCEAHRSAIRIPTNRRRPINRVPFALRTLSVPSN